MAYKKQCKLKGCRQPHYAKDLCKKHYEKYRRQGSVTDVLEMLYEIITGECMLENCNQHVFIHGLCAEHYTELTQKGVIKQIENKDKCCVKKCREPLYKNGLCQGHFDDFEYVHQCRGKIKQSIGQKVRRFKTQKVDIGDIEKDDDTFKIRKDIDTGNVTELARSIATVGLLHPLTLLKKGDGYVIVSGFYRYAAHRLLIYQGHEEFKKVDARIIPEGEMKEEALIRLSMDENFKRNFISRLEAALKAEELRMKGYSPQQIAELMGTNMDSIKKYHSIVNRAEKPVLEALHNDQITLKHAYALLDLTGQKQVKWLHKVLDQDMSARQLEKTLKEKQEKSFEKEFKQVLSSKDSPLSKAGRGTYVVDPLKLEGIDMAREFYRFLKKYDNKIEV